MSQERLSMKKLREVLRLHYQCNLSNRKIAKVLSLSTTTIGNYLKAASASGLDSHAIAEMSDAELIKKLGPYCSQLKSRQLTKKPDFVAVHKELKKKGVTRELLHEEYCHSCDANTRAMSYTEFCRQYREFKKVLKPSMRQVHVAGGKTFIDYAGLEYLFTIAQQEK